MGSRINTTWKDGELVYCLQLVVDGGNNDVGRSPENVISYLKLQAASATRDGEAATASLLYFLATAVRP
jgi:hypothetical protein